METERVAQVLDAMGTLLELQGENPFRCRAYHNAAQALRGLPGNLADRIAEDTLGAIPGIGDTLRSKIIQLVTTGRLPAYDDLCRRTPPGLVALLRIPGLGPRKIQQLHAALKIESLADLRRAAQSGQIAPLKGFGAKTEAKILEGIAFVETASERVLQSTARRLADPLLAAVRALPGVIRAELCGSLRRRAETIGDLDILFSAADPVPILAAFVERPEVAVVLAHGPTRASVRLAGGVQCDLRGVRDDQFACALHYFTGSKAHNIAMRRRAQERGLKLNEYALEGPDGPVPCPDETALFAALDLPYIPPELREDAGEFSAGEARALPVLIERSDLTGTFHCHTDWSDGSETLEAMAGAARARGLQYLGIADHSRSAGYAGGLSIERVQQQWQAIDALNAQFGSSFRLFKGIECDILADGTLDYPDEVLAGFDYVVASVHSRFGQPRDEMTARICRAVRNPYVTMLGHATGRLLLTRAGYEVDLHAVIAAAAEAGTMIEINANPHRLDLDAVHVRAARSAGVPIVINPDAHDTEGLDDLDYGVAVARRGWLTRHDVFNTGTLAEVVEGLRQQRARANR